MAEDLQNFVLRLHDCLQRHADQLLNELNPDHDDEEESGEFPDTIWVELQEENGFRIVIAQGDQVITLRISQQVNNWVIDIQVQQNQGKRQPRKNIAAMTLRGQAQLTLEDVSVYVVNAELLKLTNNSIWGDFGNIDQPSGLDRLCGWVFAILLLVTEM